jgi:hypothetical protein
MIGQGTFFTFTLKKWFRPKRNLPRTGTGPVVGLHTASDDGFSRITELLFGS